MKITPQMSQAMRKVYEHFKSLGYSKKQAKKLLEIRLESMIHEIKKEKQNV
jgi:hypothetical protein